MSLARNVFVQSGLTLGSRVLGFLRDVVIFAKLGAGPVNDAFLTALQFPNLFRRILAEGAFAQAFGPIYAREQIEQGDESAARLATETLSVMFTATLALCVAAQLAMPWIMLLMQAGYRDDPDIFNLSILLTQITMPYLMGMVLSALFAGVLNVGGKFALSAGAPTLLNLCLLIAALSFDERLSVAMACSAAITISGALQAALLYWGVRRLGVDLKFRMPRLTSQVRRVIGVAVPGALAGSATQINLIVSGSIASLEEGAKSWLASADRLYQLPLGLVGVAVGVAILPRLSRAAAAGGSPEDGRKTLDEGVGLAMALTLPATVALIAIPFFLIEALFGRGAFSESDSHMAAMALANYAWGVPAFVLVKVLSPGFFAREDTVTPMYFAIVTVLFNTLAGAGAFFWLRSQGHPGFPGLAAATSIAAWLNVILLGATLVLRGVYRPGGALWFRMIRIALACAAMGAFLKLGEHRRSDLEAILLDSKFLAVIALAAAAALVYAVAALLFGAVSLKEIRRSLSRSA